jgi:acetyltransferase EpsM
MPHDMQLLIVSDHGPTLSTQYVTRLASDCGMLSPTTVTTDDLSKMISHRLHRKPLIILAGDSTDRLRAFNKLRVYSDSITLARLIHPTAIISSYANVSPGCVVSPGVIVNPCACLGLCTTIYHNTIIEHDVSLHSFCTVGSSTVFGGAVTVEAGSYIGDRVSINQKILIGGNSFIDMDTAVIASVPPQTSVRGVPGRPYKSVTPKA